MTQLLSLVVLSALVVIGQAAPQFDCHTYLDSTSYQQAVGRWVSVYGWSFSSEKHTGDTGITFEEPSDEEIARHRRTDDAEALTQHPKLLATYYGDGENLRLLLDVTDKLKVVVGYYDQSDDRTLRLRRLGDFLAVTFCRPGQYECTSADAALLLHRSRTPERAAAEAAAACVEVPNRDRQLINYA